MNGTRFSVHQSSSRIDNRKLVSITRSPSVAVVSEIAPMWNTASSRRPFSQSDSSAGGTTSASWRLARFFHLSSWPRTSHTATSLRPASLRRRHDVRSDKTGASGYQQHDSPASICAATFAPLRPGRQLEL